MSRPASLMRAVGGAREAAVCTAAQVKGC